MLKSVFEPAGFTSLRVLIKQVLLIALALLILAFLLAWLLGAKAYGDVGVVLNDSLDTSVARITGSGHSAVYLSRICPESPIKLRLCRAGEQGSIMSNYTTLGEDQPFEWNIVPLSMFLYGVENPRHRPIVQSAQIKHVLEERYREKYLSAYCDGESCRTSNKAEWREMVGATLSRSIYMFVIETTSEQDRAFIADFNSQPNENHFNGMTRNCADFTRRVINTFFPHATGPDYINDFGMTSPKAIARSFTRFARKHPEERFRVYHFAQLPGTIKRSSPARSGSEQLYRSKKLLVPMLIFADHELPFFAASYVLTGRFNPEHELEEHPTVEATEVEYRIGQAKSEKDTARVERLEAVEDHERDEILGTKEEWKNYRDQFDSMVGEAVREEVIPDRGYLSHLFKRLDDAGAPVADKNGTLWLDVPENGRTIRLGLSSDNVFAPGSDPHLAYELVLARTESLVKSPKHSRETMVEFKKDWALLQYSHGKNVLSVARTDSSPPSNGKVVHAAAEASVP